MKDKIKITFLLDKTNNWFYNYINRIKKKFNKKYFYQIKWNYKKVKNQNIVLILSYTKILPKDFLIKNELNIVIHSSKLPNNKGFAPLSYQILEGKKKIFNTMFKISEKVDEGEIIIQNSFNTNETDLYPDLRAKQANSIIKLILKFLKIYPKIKLKKQRSGGSFNKKRTKEDSEINIDKSIKSQFNLLRICDNEKFPAFFHFKKKKYVLKIFKVN